MDFDGYPCKKNSSVRMAVTCVMELADYIKQNSISVEANPRALTLLVPYSIYQASVLHIRILAFIGPDPRCHYWAGHLYDLKSLLVAFGKTWKISGMCPATKDCSTGFTIYLEEYLERIKTAESDLLLNNPFTHINDIDDEDRSASTA